MRGIIIKSVVSVLLCFALVLSCTGCFFKGNNSDKTTTKESDFNFFELSQEERNEYVAKYIKDKYGEEYEVIDNVQRIMKTVFTSTDYCVGRFKPKGLTDKLSPMLLKHVDSGNADISVWVYRDGDIEDTAFLRYYQDKFNKIYSDIIKKVYPNCLVYSHTKCTNPPAKDWQEGENAIEILGTEQVYAFIYLVVQKSNNIIENDIEELAKKIDFCSGEIMVYEVDDFEEINELKTVDYSFMTFFNKSSD